MTSPLFPAPAQLLDDIRALLGPAGIREGADMAAYLTEPRGRWQGQAAIVARPQTTEQIGAIVAKCAAARTPVVPYGGGTGLVGGQIATGDMPAPVVISLDRMNRIRHVDATDNIIEVEAGAILEDIQNAAADADRLFPLALAAQGSCLIGGNLATNAGGVQVLRYGNARDLCLGLEAVLPDGSIWHGLKRLRKDNTGYDLKNLLIGSEGTLGIITAASLKLFARPAETATAYCAVRDPAASVDLLHHMQAHMGETISAFELISHVGPDFCAKHLTNVACPLSPVPEWSVLVEAGGPADARTSERMEAALASAFETELVVDGVLAQSAAQRDAMWHLRESIPLANRAVGAIASHDISAPISALPDFITQASAAIAAFDPALIINCFGHVGDGNLHFNIFPAQGRNKAEYAGQRAEISMIVHDMVDHFNGSVSAEHGIGRLKTAELSKYSDPTKLAAMRAIKNSLDPVGIMNPGAILPFA